MTGYCDCLCRDCFNVAIATYANRLEFCHECREAECEPGSECQAPGAYGCDDIDDPGDMSDNRPLTPGLR